MASRLQRIKDFLHTGVFELDLSRLGWWRRLGVQLLRFFTIALGGYGRHRGSLHAAGLTYFAMLAFVPVLCLLMVFAKTCGVGELARTKVNRQIDAFIANVELVEAAETPVGEKESSETAARADAQKELAEQARKVANDLLDRVDKFNVGTLGMVGLLMLAWTVISTFGQIEISMDEIWEVAKPRPLWKKCILYLFIALVMPLLTALALSMPVMHVVKAAVSATLGAAECTRWAGHALTAMLDSRLFGLMFTLVFAAFAFTFLLKMLPNRKVEARAAFEGGFVTAVLFGGWLKLCTTAGVGIAKSSALYGSFAAVPILLAWLFTSWKIVLLGSSFTYAFQCVHHRVRALPRD